MTQGSGRWRGRRTVARVAVLAVVVAGLALPLGLGTPSAVGVGEFFLLCPLGGIEALLASKSLIPQVLISLVVVGALALLFGRSWCAWGCPAKAAQSLFKRTSTSRERPACAAKLSDTVARDKRLWVLGGVLAATLVVGFPVFCLVCPIGLSVGTLVSLWRLVQFSEVGLGLLVFPAALIVEMVVMRKWCVSLCPIAALLALAGRFARVGRPQVETEKCLQEQGGACNACERACPEAIALHGAETVVQLADCTRCGCCVEACPQEAIALRLWAPVVPRARDRADDRVSTISADEERELSAGS